MTYHQEIINRIIDSNAWPSPERADFLEQLNQVADEAFNQDSVEGYLAAVLIYHQLTEELLKILIDCSIFFIQLKVFPQEYSKKDLKGKMFGQIIQELKHSVMNDNTKELISQSQKLNALRIRMVHKLTLKSSLRNIKRQCNQAKKIFDKIFEIYEIVYDNYRVAFSTYKKYPEELEGLLK